MWCFAALRPCSCFSFAASKLSWNFRFRSLSTCSRHHHPFAHVALSFAFSLSLVHSIPSGPFFASEILCSCACFLALSPRTILFSSVLRPSRSSFHTSFSSICCREFLRAASSASIIFFSASTLSLCFDHVLLPLKSSGLPCLFLLNSCCFSSLCSFSSFSRSILQLLHFPR